MEHVSNSATAAVDVLTRGHQPATTEGQEQDEDVYEYVSASG